MLMLIKHATAAVPLPVQRPLAPGSSLALQYRHQRPGQPLGIELQAVVVAAVGHIKDVNHAFTLGSRMPQPQLRKHNFTVLIFHFGRVAQGTAVSLLSVAGDHFYSLIDQYRVVHTHYPKPARSWRA